MPVWPFKVGACVIIALYSTFLLWIHFKVYPSLVPWLPNTTYDTFALFMYLCCNCWYVLLVTSKPGYLQGRSLSPASADYSSLPQCDKCPKRKGSLCNLKPLRTHHCKRCHRCVALFDHHCDIIVNCTGLGNHCSFIKMLGFASFCTIVLLAEEIWFGFSFYYSIVWEMSLRELIGFAVPRLPCLFGTVGLYAATSMLFVVHLRYAVLNQTTLEDIASKRTVQIDFSYGKLANLKQHFGSFWTTLIPVKAINKHEGYFTHIKGFDTEAETIGLELSK